MRNIEIEQKFPVLNGEEVASKISASGAILVKLNELQDDRYYRPAHRDFLEPPIVSEWLRLRFTDRAITLNYKCWQPVGAEVQTHCDEYETVVGDPDAVLAILNSLNFTEIVRVRKVRSTYSVGQLEVALDQVDGLGTFVEVEFKGVAESIAAAHDVIRTYLVHLGAELGTQDKRGYPYQLLNRVK